MLRSELIASLLRNNPTLDVGEVERIVDLFFDTIGQQLMKGGRVEIRGFGTFFAAERDLRNGRNPRTGEPVLVQSKRYPRFRASKTLHSRLK